MTSTDRAEGTSVTSRTEGKRTLIPEEVLTELVYTSWSRQGDWGGSEPVWRSPRESYYFYFSLHFQLFLWCFFFHLRNVHLSEY